MLCVSALIFVAINEPAFRMHPVSLYDGDALMIGREAIPPTSLRSITPLRSFRYRSATLIELAYDSEDGLKTVVILSKPDWLLTNIWESGPRSLRLLLKRHPGLKAVVREERVI